jgi:hypothetical protein
MALASEIGGRVGSGLFAVPVKVMAASAARVTSVGRKCVFIVKRAPFLP